MVLAGLNIEGTAQGQRGTSVLWDAEGRPQVQLGASSADFKTAEYDALAAHEETMERQEKTRLLYVAATRARAPCSIIG